jgi:protein subunit release factor A
MTPVLRRINSLKKSYINAKMSLQNAKMNLNKPNKLSILSSRNKELRQRLKSLLLPQNTSKSFKILGIS